MQNIQKFYFFRCIFCGTWYYTNKIIKTKKCWRCNRTFKFSNSDKFTKSCSINGAITIIKKLKIKKDNNLTKYINSDKCQTRKISS